MREVLQELPVRIRNPALINALVVELCASARSSAASSASARAIAVGSIVSEAAGAAVTNVATNHASSSNLICGLTDVKFAGLDLTSSSLLVWPYSFL
jgi:hypothetical protein